MRVHSEQCSLLVAIDGLMTPRSEQGTAVIGAHITDGPWEHKVVVTPELTGGPRHQSSAQAHEGDRAVHLLHCDALSATRAARGDRHHAERGM